MATARKWWLAPDLLLPLLVMLPLYVALLPGGLPDTADGRVHFIRSAEMVHAWRDGVWLPGWAANLGHGYGLPLFLFAPPLPYWLTAFFHQLGFPLEAAYKLMLACGVFAAGLGAYTLCRTLLGRPAGAVGAAAFLYAPILLRELFIQGNAAQYWAWAWAPWAAWGIVQLYRRNGYRVGTVLVLAVAGAILSHNAIALLVAGLVATMAVTLWLFTRSWPGLLATASSALLGLGISAWFWLPALIESRYLRLDRIVMSDFRTRFIPVSELLALSPRLDAGAINPYYPLTLGAVQVGLALLGLLVLLTQTVRGRWGQATVSPSTLAVATGFYFTLLAAFGAFMATSWSEPLWAALPFLDLFEWPFRWHGFTAVGLSWLGAFAVANLAPVAERSVRFSPGRGTKAVEAAGAVGCLLVIGSALVNLYPRTLPPGTLHGAPADIVRFESRSAAIGTTSLGEFDPVWTNGQLNRLPIPAEYGRRQQPNRLPDSLPPGAEGMQTASRVQQHRFHLRLAEPEELSFKLLYFPGWTATADGATLPAGPHLDTGLLTVQLPAGEHELTLRFGATPLRRVALAITLASGLALLLALVHRRRMHRAVTGWEEVQHQAEPTPPGRFVFLLLGCVVLLIGVREWLPGWFQRYTPPNHTPPVDLRIEADFDDQLRLLGADRPSELAAPGDTVEVVTYWRALQPLETDYAVFLHLDELDGTTVVAVDYRHPADIPTTTWSPNLYVRAPFQLRIPPGLPPIHYRLRVGVVDRGTGEWLGLRGGRGDVAEVSHLWLSSPEPRPPVSKPLARFGADINLLDVRYEPDSATATLFWQCDRPIDEDYTIFVHALAADGHMIGQIDGAPYQNRYPTSRWRPGQIIEDVRPLGESGLAPALVERLAIGLYTTTSGERLPAYGSAGEPLAGDSLVVVVGQ